MDPLSALRLASSPGLGAGGLQKMAGELVGQKIPAADLEKLGQTLAPTMPTGTMPTSGDTFSNVLGQMVHEVGAKQTAASDSVNGLLSGQNVSLHQTMMAMEEASVSFQLMVEVRNKLLESYQELMRMQV